MYMAIFIEFFLPSFKNKKFSVHMNTKMHCDDTVNQQEAIKTFFYGGFTPSTELSICVSGLHTNKCKHENRCGSLLSCGANDAKYAVVLPQLHLPRLGCNFRTAFLEPLFMVLNHPYP